MFPPSWRIPDAEPQEAADLEHGFLDNTMRSCPLVLIVVYDTRKRAPASEGDGLGLISMGCVMQNMWLMAESLKIGLQIMSVFSAEHAEQELRRILSIPDHMKIAFACRLGYPAEQPGRYLRVRRDVHRFTHHNSFAAHRDCSRRARILEPQRTVLSGRPRPRVVPPLRCSRVDRFLFHQADPHEPPMLVHPVDRVPVQLKLADDSRRKVNPACTQFAERHR